jgi:hypothetical protein
VLVFVLAIADVGPDSIHEDITNGSLPMVWVQPMQQSEQELAQLCAEIGKLTTDRIITPRFRDSERLPHRKSRL